MKVWKFTIADPETAVTMPKGAEVLHIGTQDGESVCLWALVDPDAERVDRRFVVSGTGHHVPDERGRFLGTVLLYGGVLVFHVWDLP